MKIYHLDSMIRGWFVGNFEPSAYRTEQCEVALKTYNKGDYEDGHYHKIATEITLVVQGRITMNNIEYISGDIIIVEPNEVIDFYSLADETKTVVVKIPGANNDKYINDIKVKVLKSNEQIHDLRAANHTRSVPYQCRKRTANYIHNLILNQLSKHNVKIRNADVLEIGCGTGTFVDLFIREGCKFYTGIDISGEMINVANKNNNSSKVAFKKISLEDFSINNKNKYDIIIASSFLHHLYDIEEGLSEIRSMLKSDGIFIGLHEVILGRKWTPLEVLDGKIAFLLGYMGGNGCSIINRIRRIFKKHTSISNALNYVDYQLNFEYDLNKNEYVNKYCEVIPYCYYNFSELRFIKKINNHNMIIMKNR